MRIRVDAERADPRKLQPAIEALRKGKVVVYPTDTGYAFGCALSSPKGIAALRKLKGIDEKHWKPLTMLVDGLPAFGRYGSMDNSAFRIIRRLVPGPYTIVLKATSDTPKTMRNRAHEVGMRLPEHRVCALLIEGLGEPLLTGSVLPLDDEPELMEVDDLELRYQREVDVFVDTGPLWPEPSTVLRFGDGGGFEVLREGQGPVPT
jgi:tRNA threonylcarbamoyl adenosine modification protein (Sua5/YciO/YrdC/YwlC family)